MKRHGSSTDELRLDEGPNFTDGRRNPGGRKRRTGEMPIANQHKSSVRAEGQKDAELELGGVGSDNRYR